MVIDTVIISDLEFVGEVLEEERLALCEPRYQHDPPGQALQAGSVRSSLSLGGRRELSGLGRLASTAGS